MRHGKHEVDSDSVVVGVPRADHLRMAWPSHFPRYHLQVLLVILDSDIALLRSTRSRQLLGFAEFSFAIKGKASPFSRPIERRSSLHHLTISGLFRFLICARGFETRGLDTVFRMSIAIAVGLCSRFFSFQPAPKCHIREL